jgi:hypothetical protein
VREAAKKAREGAYLQRFRENFADFPDGEVVTRVPRSGTGRGSGLPDAAQEGTEDKVQRMASEQHQSKGLPPVVVHALWRPHQALDRRRIPELAADLANLVQEHLPEMGHSVTIRRRRHPAWRSLPQEVASLTVVRWKSISTNSWTPVRASFVPTLTPPELQQIMRNKEAKVPSYRHQCREVWLLIVARGLEPSAFGDLGSEVEGYRFESGFDRVFFLHYFDGAVTELRVLPSGLDSSLAAQERTAAQSARRVGGYANKEDDT